MHTDLKRKLDWIDAAAIFVGIILGSGIFVAPAAVAAATDSNWIAAGMWILGAIVAASGALCYAECGARLPKTGGFYVYYREVWGEGVAFVCGWTALLITYPASLAAIALILANYLQDVVPWGASPKLYAAVAVVLAGAINILGVRTGANTQRALTAFKVLALLLLCVAALTATPITPEAAVTELPLAIDNPTATLSAGPLTAAPLFPGSIAVMLSAMVILLWTYDGWSDVTLIGGELRDPGRDFGRTVVFGISVLACLYVLVQLAINTALTPAVAGRSQQVVADAVAVGLGTTAGRLVAVLVVISTFGAINGVVLTASRLGYAMAKDGAFLRVFAAIHPKFGTPARSTVALVIATVVYVIAADFGNLMAFFSFNVWLFYSATAVGLLILRHRKVGEPPSWRLPGGIAAPIVVIVTAVAMTSSLMIQDPKRSLVGLAMLAGGIPVYLVWRALFKVAPPMA